LVCSALTCRATSSLCISGQTAVMIGTPGAPHANVKPGS
jgi:hypothetical protein